ncbi:MAG: Crp/Fnr family transcriptional regulator [Magnetococcales bacterium]|nr:Crp/Fnr family transcriptional regulator [Magnetococcales bacterium]MBF0155695.1 Crp/Fnr family transcriptional regulator [Magnetococcales bacterium]
MELSQVVTSQDMSVLQAVASPVSLHRGETLFEEGETEDALYVVRRGTVEFGHPVYAHHWVDFGLYGSVDLVDGDDPGSLVQWRDMVDCSTGAVLGDHAFFSHGPHAFSALCLTDCDLLRLDGGQLIQLRDSAPGLYRVISDDIAQR